MSLNLAARKMTICRVCEAAHSGAAKRHSSAAARSGVIGEGVSSDEPRIEMLNGMSSFQSLGGVDNPWAARTMATRTRKD